jgi:hypothetical protein
MVKKSSVSSDGLTVATMRQTSRPRHSAGMLPEAVRKFRKWQSQRKRATVSIEQPLGESWIGEKLKAKFPDHKVTIKSNAVWETVVDDAAFWQKVTAFLRDPNGQRIAAQRTGNHPT